jgi:aspartyl-tRNA(Asn)/glutamyl-tRNA(Gln) amidotransferase subunit A
MLDVLRSLGAQLEPVSFPFDIPGMMRSSDRIILSEAYAGHADYIDRDDLPWGAWVARRIRAGRHISAHDYLLAQAERRRLAALYRQCLAGFDAYLLPTVPGSAPLLEEIDEDRTSIGMFTRFVNYVGSCALSMPMGLDASGMPISMQLVGQPGQDCALLSLGESIQAITAWHGQRPPACT